MWRGVSQFTRQLGPTNAASQNLIAELSIALGGSLNCWCWTAFIVVTVRDVSCAEAAYAVEPNRLFGLTGLAIVHKAQKRDADAARTLASLIAEFGDNGIYQQDPAFKDLLSELGFA